MIDGSGKKTMNSVFLKKKKKKRENIIGEIELLIKYYIISKLDVFGFIDIS